MVSGMCLGQGAQEPHSAGSYTREVCGRVWMDERQREHEVGVQESMYGGGAMRLSRSAKEHPLLKLSSKDSRVLAAPRKGLVTTYC